MVTWRVLGPGRGTYTCVLTWSPHSPGDALARTLFLCLCPPRWTHTSQGCPPGQGGRGQWREALYRGVRACVATVDSGRGAAVERT